MKKHAPLNERFWPLVKKADGCWLWAGRTDKNGYGQITIHGDDGLQACRSDGVPTPRQAHRVMWELTHGPIPDNLQVLHHCDNPPCVNPDPAHLFLGTPTVNDADRDAKGRNVLGVRHPLHKLTDDDVRFIRANYGVRGRGGLSMPKLAEQFGVDVALIHRIIRRRAWPHIA